MRLFLNIFRKFIIFLFIAGVVFSNLPANLISEYINYYRDSVNVVDNMWGLRGDENVVDNFATLNQIVKGLKVKEAQAANAGQMVLYFHKEASDYNQLYNSLNWAPPEPAADTASGVTSTVNVNANPPTALCESTDINIANQGNYNKIGSSGAAAAVRCLASFISPPVGQAFSIATGDAVITPVMWIQDGAATGTSTTYLYFYKLCAAAGGDCAGAGSLVRFETASSTTDPGTTITAAAITASAPDVATTFAAGDRIAAVVARADSTTTAMYILVDNTARTAGNVSRVTIKYTAITPNKPSLVGAKDDDFTVGAATTACTTGGVAYNTKWTCLQGTAASTAGAFNNGNAAGTTGDSTDWLWLRNQTTATTAVPLNFGATPSNTFLYQTLNAGYGDGTVRTTINSSTTYTIGATAPTTPWNHSGLALWTSNTDYIEVQVHSTAQTDAASTGTVQVALNNCTASCTGNNGTITNVSLNPTATSGVSHRVWIGFSKTGTNYQAQYSTDGTTWNSVGSAVAHATEFGRVGLNAYARIANPISTYSGAFEWFQHTFAAPAATLTIGATAGSKVANLNSGDTLQYANTTGCASAAACAAFTLSLSSGSDTVTSIGVTMPAGQTTTTNLSNLALFYDADGNYSNGVTGQYGATVAALAANGSPTAIAGSLAISTGTTYYFYVRFDLINGANNPAGGETVQFQILNNADVTATAIETGAPQSMAGTTTILPNATSVTYQVGGDGGRSGYGATISGYGFDSPLAGSRANCAGVTGTGCVRFTVGGNATVADADATSWTSTSIAFTVNAALASEGGAVALQVVVASQSDATNLTFYVYPTISSYTAVKGDGDVQTGTITISGDHFGTGGTTANVSINGTAPASLTWTSSSSLTSVDIPDTGTDSGTITVTRASDSKASNTSATFYIYPTISSYTATFADGGYQDGTITITGNHLGSGGTTANISFNGATPSSIGVWSATSVTTVDIPNAGTDSGTITVTNPTTTKTSNASATFIIYPQVVSLTVPTATPDAAREYDAADSDGIITVNGNHFGAAGTVTVLGSSGTQQTTGTCVGSAYQATCTGIQIPTLIADNAYTGSIILTRTSDAKTNTYAAFRVLPRVLSLTPNSGEVGTSTTIAGNHFCQTGTCQTAAQYNATADDGNDVKWGTTNATVTGTPSDTSVVANAPAIATGAYNVTVVSNTYVSNGKTFTILVATITIASTAGSKVTVLNSGDTSQYANTTGCASAAACSAFTLSISSSSDTVTSIKITQTGTSTATTDMSNLALFYDTDGNYSNGVTGQYGTTVASFTSQAATVSGSLAISSGTTYYFYVRSDIKSGTPTYPKGGQTINFQIAANGDIGTSGSPTKTGAPVSLAGTTTVLPNATSVSYVVGGDGGRSGNAATISGFGFGAPTAGANQADCITATVDRGCVKFIIGGTTNVASGDITLWTNTSIAFNVVAGLASDGGASSIEVRAGNQADATPLTYYVYPNIVSLTVPTATPDAAREYDAADSDGIITVNGNHFGAAGTVTVLGSSGTQQTTGTCVGSAYQATCTGIQIPTLIADNAYTGSIILTRTSDAKTNTYAAFRVLPRIASTAPVNLKGGRGDTVSVAGDHLCQSGTCPTLFSAANSANFNGGSVTSGASTWTDTSVPSIIIPGAAIDGNLNITSNTAYTSNNLTYDIKFAPTTPTNGNPAGQVDIVLNPTLNSSAFSDGTDGDTHIDSEWQIDEEGTFVAPEWTESLAATANTSVVVNTTNGTFANNLVGQTSLACGKTYSFRIRFKDNAGVTSQEWSGWSGGSTFNTLACGPDATSVSNSTEAGLTDGGRIGHTIVISGASFGTVNAGSRANCAGGAGTGCVKIGGTSGQMITDTRVTAWSATSITIQLSLTDITTNYGGATTSGLMVYAAGVSDPNGLTFYVYPDITSITAPLGTNTGAREYDAGDTDGVVTITGNKFGATQGSGSVSVLGQTATINSWSDTSIQLRIPIAISDSTDSGYIIATQGTGTGGKTTNSTDAEGAINIWPRVTGISAATFSDGGYQDGTFTLNGNHFGATAGTISANGATQDGTPTWGAASITGVGIPNTGTDSGNIILTKSDAKTSNTFSTFYIYPQITSYTATNVDGDIQTGTITISGNHFGTGGLAASISFNGVTPSSIGVWSATSVTTVDIPNAGTDSGTITVTNPTTSKASNVSVTFIIYPQITSLTVPTATADAAREYLASDSDGVITANGNHFGVAGTVTVIGSTGTQQTTATCIGTAYQATCVGLQIPTAILDSTYTGNIVLTRTSDTKTFTYAGFRVLSRIISLSPNTGATNDPIIIIGNHLCQTGTCPLAGSRSTASDNVTFFSGVQVTDGNVTAWGHGDSSTSGVNVNVPSAAATGNIVVKSNTIYDSNGVNFTKLSSVPADPTNLLQFKTGNDTSDSPPTHDPLTNTNPDGKVAVGGGINQTNTWLRATAQAGINATLCIEVEAKTVVSAFDGIGTVLATGAPGCQAFTVGTPVKLFVNVTTGLTDGNNYKWRSRIKNSGTGEYSNWVNASVDGQSKSFYIDISAPSALSAVCPPTTLTASTADLSWSPTDNISTTFTKQAQYGTDSTFTTSTCAPDATCGTPTGGLGANPQANQLTGLAPSTVYYYRVRSKDAAGNEKVEGYGLSANTTCTFTTSKANMRTAEFIITGETGAVSVAISRAFQVYITEQGSNVQSAFVELSGIASANASNLTLGLKVAGSVDPGYTNYTIATSATVSTPFTILHKVDPTASGLYVAPTQATSNNLWISPSGGPSVYIASAKIVVTYYYTP